MYSVRTSLVKLLKLFISGRAWIRSAFGHQEGTSRIYSMGAALSEHISIRWAHEQQRCRVYTTLPWIYP